MRANSCYADFMISLLRNSLHESGVVDFEVKVRPGAAATRMKEMLENGVYKFDVAAAPEDGKANAELIRFLAEEFGVAKTNIEILSGQSSPLKRIRVRL